VRVVDASILPDIPSVPTNVTTIMVAERIAAKLTAEASVTQFQRDETAAYASQIETGELGNAK
jgi:choline dehydrogenase-like flavoprotein